LTRAALRDAPLLVLDEPTASLDRALERQVSDAVKVLGRDRTVIVIAHRLATVQGADRIILLEEGRVAEEGTHASLLAAGGLYAGLIRSGEAFGLPETMP
jgi:ABC-type multidrug transport system fused ATPase/permease subunit